MFLSMEYNFHGIPIIFAEKIYYFDCTEEEIP